MAIKILDKQRSLTPVGVLRIGESVPVPGQSYNRPTKLDTFKGTSQSRELIEALAAMAGGVVKPWQPQGIGRPGWGVVTEARLLHVVLPPYDEYSQHMEFWNGGRCVRRCDSEIIINQGGAPCVCDLTPGAARTKSTCKPTTRVNVMLYNPDTDELLSFGTWKIESHGWNTGDKVPLQIDIIRKITPPGQLVRATVELVEGSKMIENPRKPGEYQLSVWKEFLFQPLAGTAKAITGTTGLRQIEAAPAAVAASTALPTSPLSSAVAAEFVPDDEPPADEPPVDAEEVEAVPVDVLEPELIARVNATEDLNQLRRDYRIMQEKGWLTPAVTEAAKLRQRQLATAEQASQPSAAPTPAETLPAEGAAVTTREAALMECLTAAGSRGWTTDQLAVEFEMFLRNAFSTRDVALHDATGPQLRAFAAHLSKPAVPAR